VKIQALFKKLFYSLKKHRYIILPGTYKSTTTMGDRKKKKSKPPWQTSTQISEASQYLRQQQVIF
jgi:hypothetical protein